MGLLVRGVVGVRLIPGESLQDLPPLLKDAAADVISAIGTLDNELLLILNGTRLAPEDLWDSIGAEEARS